LKGAPSPNPGGRGLTNRQRINERLLMDLADVWDRRGPAVLERLADEDPSKLAAIAFGILPEEAFVKVENIVDPRLKASPEALAALGGLIDAIKAANVDGEPGAIFQAISDNLPSWLGTPVIEQIRNLQKVDYL
jgi:hypothetical protein